MRRLKHLPLAQWPKADREAFEVAFQPGDLFDDMAGKGAHLSERTRRTITYGYRRWLGYLDAAHTAELDKPLAERITPALLRCFIESLADEMRPGSVGAQVQFLYTAARLMAPECDWTWLRVLAGRLLDGARPLDRFDKLVPLYHTLDYAIELMDEAIAQTASTGQNPALLYRDGLLIALVSIWPVRRRGLAALTISGHVQCHGSNIDLHLHAEHAKRSRTESCPVPEPLLPYLLRYLDEFRLLLPRANLHDGFWASSKGGPLGEGRLYEIFRSRVNARFGKEMGLHDVRRSAATFLAMDAPEMVGLIPGILQHASPDVSDKHYNLARSVAASRRFSQSLSTTKSKLRPLKPKTRS